MAIMTNRFANETIKCTPECPKGADAIIAMRYDATDFAPGVTEVLAYGTAVKLTRRRD